MENNGVAIESDAYNFECALAFFTIHPWANSKWVILLTDPSARFTFVML